MCVAAADFRDPCVDVSAGDRASMRAALLEALGHEVPNIDATKSRKQVEKPLAEWRWVWYQLRQERAPNSYELVVFHTMNDREQTGFKAVLTRTGTGWQVISIDDYRVGVPHPN